MRWVARIALALAAVVGQALVAAPAGATSCAPVVEWQGRTYEETRHRGRLAVGRGLADGVIPACDPGQGDRDRPVAVAAVGGIDPRYAIVVGEQLFVAAGFPVPLPQHPAHELVYGSPDEPDERRNCERGTTAIEADVRSPPVFRLSLEGRRDPVALDAGTELDGLPELNEGDRVRVEALACEGEGPGTTLLVAASLELLEDVEPGAAGGRVDRDVVLAVAITLALFAAVFAVRRVRARAQAGRASGAA